MLRRNEDAPDHEWRADDASQSDQELIDVVCGPTPDREDHAPEKDDRYEDRREQCEERDRIDNPCKPLRRRAELLSVDDAPTTRRSRSLARLRALIIGHRQPLRIAAVRTRAARLSYRRACTGSKRQRVFRVSSKKFLTL
jgi:hypothetical protein